MGEYPRAPGNLRAQTEPERFCYLSTIAPPSVAIIRRAGHLDGMGKCSARSEAITYPIMTRTKWITLPVVLLVGVTSCAPLQPPDPAGPRGDSAYPLIIGENTQRRDIAMATAAQLVQSANRNSEVRFRPLTYTIESLPPRPEVYLPKLGTNPVMNEEETRESLRRFLRDWQDLIGADPVRLSLVSRVDAPDGTKEANYEQRPFRFPLRGNYGKVTIRFAPNRRVLYLSSTAIPDAERLQPTIAAIVPKLTSEDAATQIRNKTINYTDANGTQKSFTIPSSSALTARDLVFYVQPAISNPNGLAFHLAWEIELTGAPVRKVYLDAVSGEVIAAE